VFWERLRELGWVKGENLVVEERWADGHVDRLPDLMSEIVRTKVDIIVTYNTAAAIAAKKATNTIPIVDAMMGDPVEAWIGCQFGAPGWQPHRAIDGIWGRHPREVSGATPGRGSEPVFSGRDHTREFPYKSSNPERAK